MLARGELERIAGTLTRGNAGQAETLYLQDVVLSTVSRETADQLVFKGGTALLKFYQLDRFSEDLEFTQGEPLDFSALVGKAVRDLENYGATVAEQSVEETDGASHARFGLEGPLFTGDRRSLCFVRIEANKGSTVSRVRTRRYTPQFLDLPSFDLAVLDETEILAEKVRALVTRTQPRDLYDVYHLLGRSAQLDPELVGEKLDYYDLEYDGDRVLEAAGNLEPGWETLSPLVYSELPQFRDAYRELEAGVR